MCAPIFGCHSKLIANLAFDCSPMMVDKQSLFKRALANSPTQARCLRGHDPYCYVLIVLKVSFKAIDGIFVSVSLNNISTNKGQGSGTQ